MNAQLAECLSEDIHADDPRQPGAALFKKLAVLYLRVSTADQMDTDYDPEGISIPTQRTKGFEKACVLGARVVKVFIEPGISATSTKGRKAFHAMMAYVRAHGNIDYVIVYARSRLHRNAADAAVTKAELKKYGCAIASVLDYTEDNLLGDLVAGILDVINEYQSRAMGQDVAEKMEGKAAAGGLPARAPIGYLNVREKIEFREVRTVIADPERRDLVVMAFELYATGMYSYKRLQATLTDAGLRTLPTKKFPSGHELSIEKIGTMLADRFYLGKVVWKGKEYQGRHEPLISQELFDRVQEVRDLQRGGGTRARVHSHYLKGALWCHRCGKRFYYVPGHSKTGQVYFYFMCAGRHQGVCDLPYLKPEAVERAVEDNYATITVSADLRKRIKDAMTETIRQHDRTDHGMRDALNRRLTEISRKQSEYVDLVGHPMWPTDKLTEKMAALTDETERIREQLAKLQAPDLEAGRAAVTVLLELLGDIHRLYLLASPSGRKALNQGLFTRIYIDAPDGDTPRVVRDSPADVVRPLIDAQRTVGASAPTHDNGGPLHVEGTAEVLSPTLLLSRVLADPSSNKSHMVAPTGFEPALLP